jgi:UMF1 family MFS transporter
MMKRDRSVIGWVLFDFATVMFAINIAGLYFPLWVVEDAGGRDAHVAVALSSAMFIILVSAPLLGSFADRSGKRVLMLSWTTATCAGLAMLIGHGGLTASLIIFALASAANGCGLIFYDALLPVVSTVANRGRISGFGIGAGFAGSIVGIATGAAILALDSDGKPLIFKVTALLFVLGALPCLLWVREPPKISITDRPRLRDDLRWTWRLTREVSGMRRFLAGRVLYTDATNTIFAFMSVYAVKEVGFSETQTQLVLLSGIIAGPIGAVTAGRATDRIGPQTTIKRLLWLWLSVLIFSALIPLGDLPRSLFWAVAPLAGFAFGGTSTVDRALLLTLAPAEHAGRFFGVFAMVGRLSAVFGPLLWALIVEVLGLGRPAAVLSLALMVIVARIVFRGLPDSRLTSTPAPSSQLTSEGQPA